jgi:hypothetical protein
MPSPRSIEGKAPPVGSVDLRHAPTFLSKDFQWLGASPGCRGSEQPLRRLTNPKSTFPASPQAEIRITPDAANPGIRSRPDRVVGLAVPGAAFRADESLEISLEIRRASSLVSLLSETAIAPSG